MIGVKAGRRNRKSDEEIIKQIITLANQLLDSEVGDTEPQEEEAKAKSEERDTVNDEERMRIDQLLKEARKLITKQEE